MKEITRYMAEDGMIFDNKTECEEYEKTLGTEYETALQLKEKSKQMQSQIMIMVLNLQTQHQTQYMIQTITKRQENCWGLPLIKIFTLILTALRVKFSVHIGKLNKCFAALKRQSGPGRVSPY